MNTLSPPPQSNDFDFIVVGSGFGGSVSALRLAEKGYRVAVLERGRRFEAGDYAKTNWDLKRYLWMPLLRCFGIQNLSLFRNVLVLSGSGVGGGSLVYANTLLKPGADFFESPAWSHLASWEAELAPHYETARKMLGVTPNPKLTFVDHTLKECAEEMGRGATFKPSQVAVYFGEPSKKVPDPYFGGIGPERTGCNFCGGCMVGCRYGAKNTLDKNYLYFAEKKGATVLPDTEVTALRPLQEGGFELTVQSPSQWIKKSKTLRAKQVVLSAGVLGTVRLLLRCRDELKTLKNLSSRLGHQVRTNSEALIGVSARESQPHRDYSEGIAISSIFHPDEKTHIEPVRYSKGSDFMRFLAAPMVDGNDPGLLKAIRLAAGVFFRPLDGLKLFFGRDWASRTVIFLVMQTVDSEMRLALKRGPLSLFRKRLNTEIEPGSKPVPSYIAVGHQVARLFAKKVNGIPQSAINEAVLNIPTTAHILGGCGMGSDPNEGVVDTRHQVFGYPGLYICDGSVLPANLGVNPSLTITAMTERAMSLIPRKE